MQNNVKETIKEIWDQGMCKNTYFEKELAGGLCVGPVSDALFTPMAVATPFHFLFALSWAAHAKKTYVKSFKTHQY